jgi:hypothetical protein
MPIIAQAKHNEKKFNAWEIYFPVWNKFEKVIIQNCYDMLRICLDAWKLRKL